jgi:hypothetical protein
VRPADHHLDVPEQFVDVLSLLTGVEVRELPDTRLGPVHTPLEPLVGRDRGLPGILLGELHALEVGGDELLGRLGVLVHQVLADDDDVRRGGRLELPVDRRVLVGGQDLRAGDRRLPVAEGRLPDAVGVDVLVAKAATISFDAMGTTRTSPNARPASFRR